MIRTLMYSLLACAVPVVVLISAARGIHLAEHGLQSSSFDLQQGRSIFAARCARCHNISGTSVAIGPNLSQIGTTAGQRKPGMTAAAYILESILKPREFKSPGSSGEMPANLVTAYDDEAIRNLVATLCSTPDTPQDNDIRSLQIDRPAAQIETTEFHREQIMRGERIYRGKAGCATCHPFYGGPELELTAPYIFFRGYRDREELRRAILPRMPQLLLVISKRQ